MPQPGNNNVNIKAGLTLCKIKREEKKKSKMKRNDIDWN